MSHKENTLNTGKIATEEEQDMVLVIDNAQKATKGDGDVQREHPNCDVGWANS